MKKAFLKILCALIGVVMLITLVGAMPIFPSHQSSLIWILQGFPWEWPCVPSVTANIRTLRMII